MKKDIFNPLDYPVCLDFPKWFDITAWAEHIPFAMYYVSLVEPKSFVELGTYRGVSYFAFCQAIKKMNAGTKCYAVDTWLGDEHAGYLENDVLTNLKIHNEKFYKDFSCLMQNTFDEALTQFENKTIDLLHIDGFHTYEAVSHDFKTWLPKMSDRGIVLFHDTNVRRDDFGVWKFWEEITKDYPNFEFLHGHGLGVLAVGKNVPRELEFLFSADAEQTNTIRNFFYRLGSGIESSKNLEKSLNRIEELTFFEQFVLKSGVLRKLYLIKERGLVGYIKFHSEKLKAKRV